jgi:hypothetical protein
MAAIEQLIYGLNTTALQEGRQVLGRSPGVTKDCAAEIVRICEAWADAPAEVGFRPVLISFPLSSLMPALPGRLFAVIRVYDGGAIAHSESFQPEGELSRDLDSILRESNSSIPLPLFHAVILTQTDYATFGLNPYALALEGIFLDRWAPGLILERRQVAPASLAPLISPLPSESDAKQIEEGLRFLFSQKKMILPLEQHGGESDRFLALLVSALPLRIKLDLCFASFAMHESNQYTLAAVFRLGSHVRHWHRFFLAAERVPLTQAQDEYLDSVHACLMRGDLLGLEQVSKRSLTGPLPVADRGRLISRESTTVQSEPATRPAPGPTPWNQTGTRVARAAHIAPARLAKTAAPRERSPRRSEQGRSSWFVTLLFLIALICGGGLLLHAEDWDWWPWNRSDEDHKNAGSTLLGVIDVGSLYQMQLKPFLQAQSGGGQWNAEKHVPKALAALRIGAAEDLDQQCRLLGDLADQGIQQPSRPDREAERLDSLAQRGGILEQEMHRLLLAYYAFQYNAVWQDLSGLPKDQLTARYDSLRRRQPQRMEAVAKELGLTGEIADLKADRLKISGLARLARLWGQKQRDTGWGRDLERTAQALTVMPLTGANAAYRACALDMAQLKRLEDTVDFGALAFTSDYQGLAWLPASVLEFVQRLPRRQSQFSEANIPPLYAATAGFYQALQAWPQTLAGGSYPALLDAVKKLSANRAVEFDPGQYGDHVDRQRVEAAAILRAHGTDVPTLPPLFCPGGQPQALRSFLALTDCQPTAEEWREVAQVAELPFFARWAQAQARWAELDATREAEEFDRTYASACRLSAELRLQAQRGEECTTSVMSLLAELGEFDRRYRACFGGDPQRSVLLERVRALAAALRQPLTVQLAQVTVRLEAAMLDTAAEVSVELIADSETDPVRTPAMKVGPAAPAGTGWVGTLSLAQELRLSPGQSLQVVVRRLADHSPLLVAIYAANEGPHNLPAALQRTLPGYAPTGRRTEPGVASGSIVFKLAEGYWRHFEIPVLTPIQP